MPKANRNILNEPFTQEMLNVFEAELIKLEKPYFKKLANSTFETAQVKVPTQSGNLRDSASLSDVPKYTSTGELEAFSIKYDTHYAYALHEGERVTTEELEATGKYPWKSYTKSYTRKDGTRVKDHIKEYKKYYRPVQIRNLFWASIDQTKLKHTGNNWVQQAWKIILITEDSLAKKLFPKNLKIDKLETDQN